jgi:hypothetical protein
MKKEPKSKLLNFRVSEKELETLEIMAMREDRSLSEMMREALREAAHKRGIYAIALVSSLGKTEAMLGNSDSINEQHT